jgi:hypothetical protein
MSESFTIVFLDKIDFKYLQAEEKDTKVTWKHLG